MRRFPRDNVAETVANVSANFDEGNRAAFHAQVLQRLDAPLLAIGELLFGEEDIDLDRSRNMELDELLDSTLRSPF